MNSIIKNKLVKNYNKLKAWLKDEQITCYRLYDRDIPDYPYTIEVYDKYCVIYEKSRKDEDLTQKNKELLAALLELAPLDLREDSIYLKKKESSKFKQAPEYNPQVNSILVSEYNIDYELILDRYNDNGLFLDHRNLRKKLVKTNFNKQKVLNLFSYTSSIGLICAINGAHTTNVDLSKTYLKWSKRNYKLNDVDTGDHLFINKDVTTFLEEDLLKYDFIYLDPPSFSNSKKTDNTLDIQRDHPNLIKLCMERLTKNGIFLFSNNLRSFKMDQEIINYYEIVDLTKKSLPFDFRDQKIHKLFLIKSKESETQFFL